MPPQPFNAKSEFEKVWQISADILADEGIGCIGKTDMVKKEMGAFVLLVEEKAREQGREEGYSMGFDKGYEEASQRSQLSN